MKQKFEKGKCVRSKKYILKDKKKNVSKSMKKPKNFLKLSETFSNNWKNKAEHAVQSYAAGKG